MAKRPDANEILQKRGPEGMRRAIADAEGVAVDEMPSSEKTKLNGKGRPKAKPKSGNGNVARRLVDKAKAEAILFATPSDEAYADVTINGRRQTLAITSQAFKSWLQIAFLDETGVLPSREAMTTAVDTLAAYALQDGTRADVHVRVAEHDGWLYLDLDGRNVVEITGERWHVLKEKTTAPVRFIRPRGMLPLSLPQRGGSINDLKPFVKTTTEGDQVLIIAWLLAALRPMTAYPVLAISGVQGAAKSTTCELLRALVDPNIADLRSPPHDVRDAFIAARNSHVVAYDNVSRIQPWLSDVLCRISTGAAQGTRKLYSDGEEMFFRATRPVLLNSIAEIVRRADLADRALVIELERIGKDTRRSKQEVRAAFDQAHPKILGALLDLMVVGLKRLPSVKLPDLPRMADFARWAHACLASRYHETMFLDAYKENRQAADDMVLDSSTVATVLRQFLQEQPNSQWEGTATTLLKALKACAADETSTRDRDVWPPDGKRLSDELKALAPPLEADGITIERERRGKRRTRTLILSLSLSS